VFDLARSRIAFKEEFTRQIKMGQVDLAEEQSAGIVVDESRCLRAVRGNGATLFLHGLIIGADLALRIGSTSVEGGSVCPPDGILEQSNFPDATLNRAGDPIGRLVVAMRIVSPADKEGSGSDVPRAVNDDANRALGLFAFVGNEAIGETEEKHVLRFKPQLRARLSCLLLVM
jgi:hypothetical protein